MHDNIRIADTHTHLYFSAFDNDRESVIERNRFHGVRLQIQIGCDEVSSLSALHLAIQNEDMYCTLGAHPADMKILFETKESYRPSGFSDYKLKCHSFDQLFDFFESLIRENSRKIVGLGETGFDLFHDNSSEILALQKESFSRHLELCRKYDLPAIIHVRNAKKEFVDFLEAEWNRPFRAVVHCFGDDTEFAQLMTQKYHFSLGIGGVLTYPKSESVREAVLKTPIEFLLTETDAPFLVPQKFRKTKKRNESYFLEEVIELIADLKKMDFGECSEILFENAKKFFRIS